MRSRTEPIAWDRTTSPIPSECPATANKWNEFNTRLCFAQGTDLEDVFEARVRLPSRTHGLVVQGDHGPGRGPIRTIEGLRAGQWGSREQPIW